MGGFQFIDILLFALIAVFLVLRLRRVLGRRDGHKGGYKDPFATDRRAEKTEDNIVHLPDRDHLAEGDRDEAMEVEDVAEEATPLSVGLADIAAADRNFDPAGFVEGARIAFEMVLGAYASGDTKALKPLLSAEVFGNFAMSIREREEAGMTLEEILVGIKSADIVEAYMEGRAANVTIKFVSEQVNVTRDEDGEVIDGDPNAITQVTDFWTFSRDTRSRDPNWTLVATQSLD